MHALKHLTLALAVSLISSNGWCQDRSDDFRLLFNERDLDGWVLVNTPESTWTVKDKMLVCSGTPTGELRTTKMYQNFILELEWRHLVPKGNAGVFVWADDITARGVPFHRSIEVQVLENAYGNTRSHTTHGDIFPIHGAKMKPVNGRGGSRAFPTENRSNPSPEWNHYRIECQDGSVTLSVNGKQVTRGNDCSPRKGYICLESEGGVVHYRNIRIQELPDTPIKESDVAIANRGYRSIYSGLDLKGWTPSSDEWQSRGWTLRYTGKTSGSISTRESFGDVGFVCDFKAATPVTLGIGGANITISPEDANVQEGWNRVEGTLRDGKLRFKLNDKQMPDGDARTTTDRPTEPLKLTTSGPAEFANVYVRELGRQQ